MYSEEKSLSDLWHECAAFTLEMPFESSRLAPCKGNKAGIYKAQHSGEAGWMRERWTSMTESCATAEHQLFLALSSTEAVSQKKIKDLTIKLIHSP